jgi:hypothetical protein
MIIVKESELSKESVWQVMILFGTRLSGMHVLGLSIFNGDVSIDPMSMPIEGCCRILISNAVER